MRLADAERFIADQELALEYWEPLVLIRREPVTISIPEFPKVRFGKKPERMVFYDVQQKCVRDTVSGENLSDPPVKVYRGSRYASKIIGKAGGRWKAA